MSKKSDPLLAASARSFGEVLSDVCSDTCVQTGDMGDRCPAFKKGARRPCIPFRPP